MRGELTDYAWTAIKPKNAAKPRGTVWRTGHSGLTPASLMIGHHFSVSAL